MKAMNRHRKTRWGCGCAFLLLLTIALLQTFGSQFAVCGPSANHMKVASNGRQILIALRQYAEEHHGAFPDQQPGAFTSSNDVFRELFKSGIVTDERIFASLNKAFVPDTDPGVAPYFAKALAPGECGWMLLKHQSLSSHPQTPVLIESAVSNSWPPRWEVSPRPFGWFGLRDPNAEPPHGKGRAWSDRRVVVVFADGSSNLLTLTPEGTLDLKSPPGDNAWLETLTPEQIAKLEYWDVEEKTP